MWWRAKIIFENQSSYLCPQRYRDDFCWLNRLLLKNVYDLAKNFQIFFKNMLLTLFYLERHVMESKNYFWELIFILMPTRISRRLFCWLDRLLLQNVYDLAKNFQIFFKNMLLTLFLSRKRCDGEQKLFLRINLHINAHKGIETMFADWTVFCWKTCMI